MRAECIEVALKSGVKDHLREEHDYRQRDPDQQMLTNRASDNVAVDHEQPQLQCLCRVICNCRAQDRRYRQEQQQRQDAAECTANSRSCNGLQESLWKSRNLQDKPEGRDMHGQ